MKRGAAVIKKGGSSEARQILTHSNHIHSPELNLLLTKDRDEITNKDRRIIELEEELKEGNIRDKNWEDTVKKLELLLEKADHEIMERANTIQELELELKNRNKAYVKAKLGFHVVENEMISQIEILFSERDAMALQLRSEMEAAQFLFHVNAPIEGSNYLGSDNCIHCTTPTSGRRRSRQFCIECNVAVHTKCHRDYHIYKYSQR